MEIVGLPEPNVQQGQQFDDMLLEVFNGLPKYENNPLTKNDIDICHPVKSERKDGKNVAVCRFIRRTTTFDSLEEKKKIRDFQYKNQSIFIT